MAKMTADELRQSLKDEVGFTDEQLTGLTKPQLEKLADAYMRQSDYDRAMNEGKAAIAAEQAKLSDAEQRLNVEMAEWGKLTNAEKANADKQRQALEAAQADVLRMRQTIERIGSEHGIDVNKILEGAPVPPKQPEQPTVDLSGVVKVEDFRNAQQQLANVMLTFPAELFALNQEHQALFGKPLDAQAIVKEIQSRANTRGNQKPLDPRAIWEELNKVPEARESKQKAEFDAAIKEAENRGRQAAISESAIPGQVTAAGRRSIVFGDGERKSAIARPQPLDTVSKAAAAFRTGKYAQQPAGAGTGGKK